MAAIEVKSIGAQLRNVTRKNLIDVSTSKKGLGLN